MPKRDYWAERVAKAQAALTEKNARQINKQLSRYYAATSKRVIEDFEAVYDKVMNDLASDRGITPADLYKLDKYWQAQAQMRQELRKLGNREIAILTRNFEANFFEVYYSFALEGSEAFNTIDKDAVTQMINQVWVADGKSWSERIWANTELLAETLNDELIHCVATGKKTTQLKALLQERFDVSYSNADMLARTELAHIQTQAAKQRYLDYGIQEVEILADKDERQCEVCGKLHGKRYPIGARLPVPAHPRCRCCVVPVAE